MTPSDLKTARLRLGLSAEAFARAVGVKDGRTVRRWESDPATPGHRDIPGPVEVLVRLWLHPRFPVRLLPEGAHKPD